MASAFDFQSEWTFVIAFLMPSMYEEPTQSYNGMVRVFLISLRKNPKVRICENMK